MIYVVLYQPEKPSNVGNIMRTCSATETKLIIIGPLTFKFDDKSLLRAGMDYIDELSFKYYETYEEFKKDFKNKKVYYVTRYSTNVYSNNDYSNVLEDLVFMFGKESSGIPHDILRESYKKTVRIPMVMSARSLNLSNCVALIVYEALRQRKFYSLATREEIKGEDFLFNETKND